MHKSTKIFALVLTLATILTACGLPGTRDAEKGKKFASIMEPAVATQPVIMNLNYHIEEQIIETEPFTDEEVTAMTKTLAGECYDDKLIDKRLVLEVILNRVADGRFGESVLDVVSAKSQFEGYWKQSRPISESDIQIAEDTLREWYKNDCKKLSEYLFFCSGPNRENVFRVSYN